MLGGTATSTNNGVVYAGAPGALNVVARTGEPAPGLPGVQFVAPQFGGFGPRVSINNAGHVAFATAVGGAGVTTANDAAIFAGAPGSLGVVARKGDAASPSLPGVRLGFVDEWG